MAKLISEVRKKLNTHLDILTKFLNQTLVLKTKIFFDTINVDKRKLGIKSKLTFYKYTHKVSKKYLITKKTKLFNLMRHFSIKTFTQLKLVINFVLGSMFLFLFWIRMSVQQTFNKGFLYIKCLLIVFIIDAILTDDEPLWEPVEWSLIQYWLIFIFLFAWIAENLITSRYGSYTGRDKRVWFAWYKMFWIIEIYYAISLGTAALFVIVPFYHEITYTTPLIVSWWDWYSRTFFLKFIGTFTIIFILANYLQITLAQFHWKKSLLIVILINLFFAYLVYVQFFITFFAYFTDPTWYSKTRLIDYIQLSHEPNKWSWGTSKRDHFSYHSSKTVFWYKNDNPFSGAMLFFNILFFLTLFTIHIFWLALTRRIFATSEITFTYTTFCISTLKQLLYGFYLIYLFVLFSFFSISWRTPLEFYWLGDFFSGYEWLEICNGFFWYEYDLIYAFFI